MLFSSHIHEIRARLNVFVWNVSTVVRQTSLPKMAVAKVMALCAIPSFASCTQDGGVQSLCELRTIENTSTAQYTLTHIAHTHTHTRYWLQKNANYSQSTKLQTPYLFFSCWDFLCLHCATTRTIPLFAFAWFILLHSTVLFVHLQTHFHHHHHFFFVYVQFSVEIDSDINEVCSINTIQDKWK